MRYLKRTIDFGLYYDGSHEYRLYGYTDADWAESIDFVFVYCIISQVSAFLFNAHKFILDFMGAYI